MTVLNILTDATVTGKGSMVHIPDSNDLTGRRGIQFAVEGPGPVSAQIKLYGSNDGRFPIELLTANLSDTGTVATEVTTESHPFQNYQAEVVSLSAGSKVNVIASV